MKTKSIIYSVAILAAIGVCVGGHFAPKSSLTQVQLENVEALSQQSDGYTVALPCHEAKSSCTVNFQDNSGRRGTITEPESVKSAPFS